MAKTRRKGGFLENTRVYLSGPMDFVASREEEKKNGWRIRVKEFLLSYGAIVFDPWEKPKVRGLHEYGKEDLTSVNVREKWTFEGGSEGAKARTECAEFFWSTMHIDLRMVDISDFVIAYCPTNIYSVGTPHEIVVARQQHKPVLIVSTPVFFPSIDELSEHLLKKGNQEGINLLKKVMDEVPVKPNPEAIPSLWYMPLIGGENFFDGFGFFDFREKFKWSVSQSDKNENACRPKRPLLKFLQDLDTKLPQRWNSGSQTFENDDDWLLLDIDRHI